MSIKADITDVDFLANIRPENVGCFLLKKGWKRVGGIAGSVIFDSPDMKARIWLPERDNILEDFVLSMAKVLATIAIFEDRSQWDIIQDFNTFQAD